MNVLFMDPPSLTGAVAESDANKLSSPNMGLLYLATCLRSQAAVNVRIMDLGSNPVRPDSLRESIRDLRPSMVGISAKTFNVLSAYGLAKIVKEINPGTLVLMGGAHPTALPEQTLRECLHLDAVILREGEQTTLELVRRITRDGRSNADDLFSELPGLVFRSPGGEIVNNGEREPMSDLDTLPFPDFSLVDYRQYRRVYNPTRFRFQHVYPVFASRGCPFNCTFCMPLHTKRHRVRSVEGILDEVERLHRHHGAQRIYFEDSLFCSKKEWFEDFCQQYARRGLHKRVQWGFETRVDTATPEMFRMARECGCMYTFFGVESGSEKVLKMANKGYSKTAILERVSAAKASGVAQVNVSIILGLPHETHDTIQETLKLIEELPCDHASINILDVYPGTAVFEMADRGEGGIRWIEGMRMNWSAYSREEPMVEVNDVTGRDLLAARERAVRIVARKSRKNALSLSVKRLVYAIEYARTDPRRLLAKLGDTFRGTR
jgi:anaerobic magnesium-protoporphyrin IX monomethyl ester cyclase